MPEENATSDYSQYVEDINDEYEFEDSPIEPPTKKDPPRKRPVSPVVTYHRKTLRNSYMLVIGGVIAAVIGGYTIVSGGLSTAISIFIAGLGIGALFVGMLSVQKTKKTITKAKAEFARDRAMRIYLACAAQGIESSEADADKDRILVVATELGFDQRKEAVGLYDVGRKLTAKGMKPDPQFDSLRK